MYVCLYSLITEDTICSLFSIHVLNEITLQKGLQAFMIKNYFWTKLSKKNYTTKKRIHIFLWTGIRTWELKHRSLIRYL